MATHQSFKRKNVPNEIIERNKKWGRENPNIARMSENQLDWYEIEVFGYNHKKIATDLHNALKKSGFLAKHPLFKIKIDPQN